MKLTGQRLYGVPIIVQPTMAEKNRLAAQAQNLMKQEGPRKVYVGCLHSDITEDMLKRIFEPFGSVENLMIQRDEAKQSKGFGFIEVRILLLFLALTHTVYSPASVIRTSLIRNLDYPNLHLHALMRFIDIFNVGGAIFSRPIYDTHS